MQIILNHLCLTPYREGRVWDDFARDIFARLNPTAVRINFEVAELDPHETVFAPEGTPRVTHDPVSVTTIWS